MKFSDYLKTYAALVGAIATALLAVYGPETKAGAALVVVSIVATAVVTWAVPYKPTT
jgi:CBS-domain-containing membrane protein